MSFKDQRNREGLKKKIKQGFRGYPVATIAYYGPTDQRASKVVVGVVPCEGGKAGILEKWYSDSSDVRSDINVNLQIANFIKEQNVKSVVAVDRIIGCPHEEGIDYPEGEKCPNCPFWENRDRWSGEIFH